VDTKSIADVCARWNIQNGAQLEHVLQGAKRTMVVTPEILGVGLTGKRADLVIIDEVSAEISDQRPEWLGRSPYP
jgi:hypothetical protein